MESEQTDIIINDGTNNMDRKAVLTIVGHIYDTRGAIDVPSLLVDGVDKAEDYGRCFAALAYHILQSTFGTVNVGDVFAQTIQENK